MAAALKRPRFGTGARLATLNPLDVRGTAMRPQILLMAKVVAISFFLSQWSALPRPFLPFVAVVDHMGVGVPFQRGLKLTFAAAALALLLNRFPRVACCVMAAVIFAGIMSSRVYYENNRMFTGCILLLAGLSSLGSVWPIQLQVLILYGAAALNKLLDVDWRTGQFFDAWITVSPMHEVYARLTSLLPATALLLSWTVMGTEVALVAGLAIRRLRPAAIWLGVAYHTALVLATGRTFGMFWFAALASYLAFVDWSPRPDVSSSQWGPAVSFVYDQLRNPLAYIAVVLLVAPLSGSGTALRFAGLAVFAVLALLALDAAARHWPSLKRLRA
jgi:Vitamin K-dependent gamma-carboxylase